MRPLIVDTAAQRFLDLDPVFMAGCAGRLKDHLANGGTMHMLRSVAPVVRAIAIRYMRIRRQAGLRCRVSDLPSLWFDLAELVERAQTAARFLLEEIRASGLECGVMAETRGCFRRCEYVRCWFEASRTVVYLFAIWLARAEHGTYSDPFRFIKALQCFEGYTHEP